MINDASEFQNLLQFRGVESTDSPLRSSPEPSRGTWKRGIVTRTSIHLSRCAASARFRRDSCKFSHAPFRFLWPFKKLPFATPAPYMQLHLLKKAIDFLINMNQNEVLLKGSRGYRQRAWTRRSVSALCCTASVRFRHAPRRRRARTRPPTYPPNLRG